MFIMFCLLCDTVYAQMTVIRPADMDALQNALDNNNVSVWSLPFPSSPVLVNLSLPTYIMVIQVSLFFTETPTNPFLRCIDVELVANMCHSKGALLCIDSTFASPINQKALTLGADLVIHSATKYIAGHNDVSWCTKPSYPLNKIIYLH
jgi:cystathionine gamma-synthase